MINLTRQLDYLHKVSFSWFTYHVNHGLLRIKQLSTQTVFKFRKNYIKQKVNRVIYPTNFVPKHIAIYSEQFIYSDNT